MTDATGKIIWSEGLMLSQQYMQYWDRSLDHKIQMLQQLSSEPQWGILELEVDEEALINHIFRLKICKAIFPQGQIITYDHLCDPILSYSLKFAETEKNISIYLGLPLGDKAGDIPGYPVQQNPPTWKTNFVDVPDQFDGQRKQNLQIGLPNLILITDILNQMPCQTIKIAEVFCTEQGQCHLNQRYIPPALNIQANKSLFNIIQNCIDNLSGTIQAIKNQNTKFRIGLEMAVMKEDMALIICAQYLTQLKIDITNHYTHPKKSFDHMLKLNATLAMFFNEEFSDFQSYQHVDLFVVFQKLYAQLKSLTMNLVTKNSQTVSLKKMSDSRYHIEQMNTVEFSQVKLILAVNYASEDDTWTTQFVRLIKIAPLSILDLVISAALPGIRLQFLKHLPKQISFKTGFEYFYLDISEKILEKFAVDKSLGVYIPQPFANAQIELIQYTEAQQ